MSIIRLLEVHKLKIESFPDFVAPNYIIASHRWEDSEITYNDFRSDTLRDTISGNPRVRSNKSYEKIAGFCRAVRRNQLGIRHLWIDTCCIDKSNIQEFSEAINSMFKWYKNAVVCYTYLRDVDVDCGPHMGASSWFTRGWTLQELLAPAEVFFFDRHWTCITSKTGSCGAICEITGIDAQVLLDFEYSRTLSVDEKMSWIRNRVTTKPADIGYCLLGILGISMQPPKSKSYKKERARLMKQRSNQQASLYSVRRDDDESRQSSLVPLSTQLGLPSSIPTIRSAVSTYSSHRRPAIDKSDSILRFTSQGAGQEVISKLKGVLGSMFRFRDGETSRPYTVALLDDHFVKVFSNGQVGTLEQNKAHGPESRMRQAYEQGGQRNYIEVVTLVQTWIAIQGSISSRVEDDESDESEYSEDDDEESDSS